MATCRDCQAPVIWAFTLDGSGERARKPDGSLVRMPVNEGTDPAGNVVLYRRELPGEGSVVVAQVLKKDDTLPLGGRLRLSHFTTCPAAKQRRRGGRRG